MVWHFYTAVEVSFLLGWSGHVFDGFLGVGEKHAVPSEAVGRRASASRRRQTHHGRGPSGGKRWYSTGAPTQCLRCYHVCWHLGCSRGVFMKSRSDRDCKEERKGQLQWDKTERALRSQG